MARTHLRLAAITATLALTAALGAVPAGATGTTSHAFGISAIAGHFHASPHTDFEVTSHDAKVAGLGAAIANPVRSIDVGVDAKTTTYALTAGTWSAKGERLTYRDTTSAHGITSLHLNSRTGVLDIAGIAKAGDIPLQHLPSAIEISLHTDTATACMRFTANKSVFIPGKSFDSRSAPAPATC